VVIGIGIDMVRIERFARAMARHRRRLLDRLFTDGERRRFEGHPFAERHLAARFAAKEAAFKAIGTGWGQGVGWREVEVVGGGREAATLALSGRAMAAAARRGIGRALVSLSHEAGYAIAVVVATDGT
jgi:holo-[acyl-carrier protein] synthase